MRRVRQGVTGLFVVNGAVFGNWAARIPAVRAEVRLGDAALGGALLAVAAGALAAMPLAPPLLRRLGGARVALAAALLFAGSLPLIAVASSLPALVAALGVAGAGNGLLDVAMNTAGADLERRLGRPVMGSLHAAFSLGVAAGGLMAAAAVALGLSVDAHFWLAALLLGGAGVAAGRPLRTLPARPPAASRPRARAWSPVLLALALAALCAVVVEGAVGDWSALYLAETLGVPPSLQGAGFVAFATAMVAGRLLTDAAVARFGPAAVVRGGGALAAAALLAALLAPRPLPAVAGFGLAGLGVAAAFPVLISAADRLPGLVPAAGVAMVSGSGYGALLAGPPVIGLLAQATSLRLALGAVVLAAAVTAVVGAGSIRAARAAVASPPARAGAGARPG